MNMTLTGKKALQWTCVVLFILLCNRWNPVPDDFENNLVSIGNYKIDATCRDALQKMLDDGNAAGHKMKILVSYRSKATQESLRASRERKYIAQGMSKTQAVRKVEASVAVPGTSEHQTGLAVDITGILVQERAPQKLDAFGAHYLFRIRKLPNYCADLQI